MTYNESEDAYYIQHGADAVPKKLQGSISGTLTIKYSYEVRTDYYNNGVYNSYGSTTVTGTLTIVIKDGSVTSRNNSGGTGVSAHMYPSSGTQFRGSTANFKITSVEWSGS